MSWFPEDRAYMIAEVGPNHDGDVEKALRIVDRVAASGADAIKFQTYARAANVVAREAPLAEYMKVGSGDTRGQLDLLDQVRLSFEDFRRLAAACADQGITFVSTPFDEPSVAALVTLGVPFIKVPSGEITNRFLLRAVARTGLPLVVSTGMASIEEIRAALELIGAVWEETGAATRCGSELVLLHCTSAYPAPHESANLRAMATLGDEFGVPVGYSDHTIGWAAPIAAAALGARIIEKHVTPDPTLAGPDHAASLPIDQLPGLVEAIRATPATLGDGRKCVQAVEESIKLVARRSLAAACSITKGEAFTEEALCALRPAEGISPMEAPRLVGRAALNSYKIGEIIAKEELDA